MVSGQGGAAAVRAVGLMTVATAWQIGGVVAGGSHGGSKLQCRRC